MEQAGLTSDSSFTHSLLVIMAMWTECVTQFLIMFDVLLYGMVLTFSFICWHAQTPKLLELMLATES